LSVVRTRLLAPPGGDGLAARRELARVATPRLGVPVQGIATSGRFNVTVATRSATS